MAQTGKIFDASAKAGEKVTENMGKAAGAGFNAGAKVVGVSAKAVGTVVGGAGAAGAGFIKGMASKPGAFAKAMTGLVAIGAVLGVAAHYLRKGAKKDQPLPEPVMDLPPPVAMGMPAQTMMGLEPTPGAHAQSVLDGRQNSGIGRGA